MTTPTPGPDHRRPSPAWWIYFGLLVVFGVGGALAFAVQFRQAHLPPAALALSVTATVLNLLGILGLAFYILQRPSIGRAFWQGVFGLTALQFLFSASTFARVLGTATPGSDGTISQTALLGLAGLALGLPLLFVLWMYAFRSPALWHR